MRIYALTFVNASALLNSTMANQQYIGIADLVGRWCYTRQGVHKLIKSAGFPKPAAVVNLGRTKIWTIRDIENYEQNKPWLFNEAKKHFRAVGYLWAKEKGNKPDDEYEVLKRKPETELTVQDIARLYLYKHGLS